MSKLRKWQCPHCPQDSTRHWNIVEHIRRKHGFGDPVEKGDSDQAQKPFSFRADKTNKREYSQSHLDNYLYTVGDKKTGRGNFDFGDIIDYVYRFLTDIEEKKYKMGEINRITDRRNSSKTPKWINPMNYDRHAFANAFQAWLSEVMKNNNSSEQRDSDSNVAASSNLKKTSLDLFQVSRKIPHQSSSSVHPVSSEDEGSIERDGWIEEDGWMVKLTHTEM